MSSDDDFKPRAAKKMFIKHDPEDASAADGGVVNKVLKDQFFGESTACTIRRIETSFCRL